jgi:hypothetical protein
MRIWDHIIRVFAFGDGSRLGMGDLRTSHLGQFGAVGGHTPLFVREGSTYDVSNWSPSRDDLSSERLIGDVSVSAWIENADGNVRTILPWEMVELIDQHLRLSVGGAQMAFRFCVAPDGGRGFRLFTGGRLDVAVPEGQPWKLDATIGEPLLGHLNGLVMQDGQWAPGDPAMTRVIRVSLDIG